MTEAFALMRAVVKNTFLAIQVPTVTMIACITTSVTTTIIIIIIIYIINIILVRVYWFWLCLFRSDARSGQEHLLGHPGGRHDNDKHDNDTTNDNNMNTPKYSH